MEEDLATHPSIFVWRIPWTERLQSVELEESDTTVRLNNNDNDGLWSKGLEVSAVDDAIESVHLGTCSIPFWGFPCGSDCKESAYNAGELVQSLGQEVPLKKEMATHSSMLTWRIPWTEESGWLQSMELQSVSHD